jgi:hypothetical protein
MASIDEGARRARLTFERLGDRVEAEWHATMYDDRALPAIARRALLDEPPHLGVAPEDVLHWALAAGSLGPQPNAEFEFGEPPITVYAGRRFYVEVLFWFSGTTAIHQHSFDGAFAVLAGSSVHSTYRFVEATRTSSRVVLGDLSHQHSEVLRPGEVRAIAHGDALIHSLFHLEHPSVSVVIRNRQAPDAGPQYGYFPPYLALDVFERHVWNRRAVDFAKAAVAMGLRDAAGIVRAAIARADDLGALRVLSSMMEGAGLGEGGASAARGPSEEGGVAGQMLGVALDAVRQKFGALAEPLVISLEENHRRAELSVARGKARRPDHRYFLALLMNVPATARLLDLLRQAQPRADPIAQCAAWLGELTSGDEPLVGYAFDANVIALVECMMRSTSFEETAARMGHGLGRPLDAAEVEALREAAASLRALPLVRPLLADFAAPPVHDFLARGAAPGSRRLAGISP